MTQLHHILCGTNTYFEQICDKFIENCKSGKNTFLTLNISRSSVRLISLKHTQKKHKHRVNDGDESENK